MALSWWDWDLPKILINLDLLYQNPETWSEDIQFREPEVNSPKSLSIQQLQRWKIL